MVYKNLQSNKSVAKYKKTVLSYHLQYMGIQERVYPYSTAGVAGVINVPNWLWRPLDPPPPPTARPIL